MTGVCEAIGGAVCELIVNILFFKTDLGLGARQWLLPVFGTILLAISFIGDLESLKKNGLGFAIGFWLGFIISNICGL